MNTKASRRIVRDLLLSPDPVAYRSVEGIELSYDHGTRLFSIDDQTIGSAIEAARLLAARLPRFRSVDELTVVSNAMVKAMRAAYRLTDHGLVAADLDDWSDFYVRFVDDDGRPVVAPAKARAIEVRGLRASERYTSVEEALACVELLAYEDARKTLARVPRDMVQWARERCEDVYARGCREAVRVDMDTIEGLGLLPEDERLLAAVLKRDGAPAWVVGAETVLADDALFFLGPDVVADPVPTPEPVAAHGTTAEELAQEMRRLLAKVEAYLATATDRPRLDS